MHTFAVPPLKSNEFAHLGQSGKSGTIRESNQADSTEFAEADPRLRRLMFVAALDRC